MSKFKFKDDGNDWNIRSINIKEWGKLEEKVMLNLDLYDRHELLNIDR